MATQESKPRSTQSYQLFLRGSAWYVRFSIRGQGQITKALKTRDRRDAERLAFDIYAEAKHRGRLGLTGQARTAEWCVEAFIRQQEEDVAAGRVKASHQRQSAGVLRRYVAGFWSSRPISELTAGDVDQFWSWRRTYWRTGPGKDIKILTYMRAGRQIRRPVSERSRRGPTTNSMRIEAVILRQFFDWAVRHGHIGTAPEIAVDKARPNARPSFSPEEITRLDDVSLRRLEAPLLHPRVRRNRLALHCYIQIMALSGLRPTEAKNLNWGDVLGFRSTLRTRIDTHDVTLRVWGKNKHRTFAPKLACIPWFHALWKRYVAEVGREPGDKDPVFANERGERILSFKKGLGELLEAADLVTDYRGVRRTAYSFRHFYITQQLIAGVDIFLLAQSCGTSSAMIEKFYQAVNLSHMKDRLRPEWTNLSTVVQPAG